MSANDNSLKLRHYVFTYQVSEATSVEYSNWRPEGIDLTKVKYFVCGLEQGESGNWHLQGYVELKAPQRIVGAKKLMCLNQAWMAARVGTREQAISYCKKGKQSHEEWKTLGVKGPNYGLDAQVVELGEGEVTQGTRSDLKAALDSIKDGKSELEMWEGHGAEMTKYHRGLDRYKNALALSTACKSEAPSKPMVFIYWGVTGSGKSHRAKEEANGDWYEYNGTGWWDGYDGQSTVIMDEFSGATMKIDEFLKLTDGKAHQVPIKGGFTLLRAKRFVLTSNQSPLTYYPNVSEEKWAAFSRRVPNMKEDGVEGVVEFTKPYAAVRAPHPGLTRMSVPAKDHGSLKELLVEAMGPK